MKNKSISAVIYQATCAIRTRRPPKKKVPKGLRGVTVVRSAEGFSLPDPDTEIVRAFLANNSE